MVEGSVAIETLLNMPTRHNWPAYRWVWSLIGPGGEGREGDGREGRRRGGESTGSAVMTTNQLQKRVKKIQMILMVMAAPF